MYIFIVLGLLGCCPSPRGTKANSPNGRSISAGLAPLRNTGITAPLQTISAVKGPLLQLPTIFSIPT